MEHLNELGTASWLGKNEKWMMGERVNMEATKAVENTVETQKTETNKTEESVASENKNEKPKNTTKLPRLLNSNRSLKRGKTKYLWPHDPKKSSESNQKSTLASNDVKTGKESLPPIDLKGITGQVDLKQKKDSDTISIKTEEEVISIVKPEKATTESIVSSKVSRKMAPVDDEVRYHRSYQVTETTYVATGRGNEEKEEEQESEMKKNKTATEGKKVEKKERAKWTDMDGSVSKREKSIEKKRNRTEGKKKEDVGGTEEKTKQMDAAKGEVAKSKEKVGVRQFDVDINEIPIRFDSGPGNVSKIGKEWRVFRLQEEVFSDKSVQYASIRGWSRRRRWAGWRDREGAAVGSQPAETENAAAVHPDERISPIHFGSASSSSTIRSGFWLIFYIIIYQCAFSLTVIDKYSDLFHRNNQNMVFIGERTSHCVKRKTERIGELGCF